MRILGPTPPRLPIGHSDYVELRQAGCTYIDKTGFVAQVLATDTKTQLYPRPRRFGKTLNLSTVRHFLERGAPDLTGLFADTEIWDADGGAWRAHFQRHPVVYLTFKEVKSSTWPEAWAQVRALVQQEVERFCTANPLAEALSPIDQRALDLAMAAEASATDLGGVLRLMTRWGQRASGESTAILIDEYDAPLLTAWQHGYWDAAVGFFRVFLGAGLKDNPHLFRGVLTGILRVAKEGCRGSGGRPPAQFLSGLNNVRSFGLLAPGPTATCFGFTVQEVEALATACGQAHQLDGIATWYNGYRFGGNEPQTIYNPWSLLEYLSHPAAGFLPYWKDTSANDLIHELLLKQAADLGPDLERLLRGETITALVDDNVALSALHRSPTALWSLLLFSGYLTAEALTVDEQGTTCELRLPNREVAQVYRTTFLELLGEASTIASGAIDPLTSAMLGGDAPAFERVLGHLLKTAMSYFDFGARPVEAVYQAFIVGLLVRLEATHRVRSNRESGFGRADVLVLPRAPGPGAVLELKIIDTDYDETREAALAAAAKQLRERQYHTEVREAGATAVHQYAVVFDGKRCWVEVVPSS